jgi:hypothetical protein
MAFPSHRHDQVNKMTQKNSNMDKERSFSIELKNKQTLKNVSLNGDLNHGVLIEGTVGKLEKAAFVCEDIFEVTGSQGTLRVNITKQDITEVTQA